MSWKKILLLVVFADFTAFTAWAVYQQGYLTFFDTFFSSWIGIQVFADLVIALSLFSLWMIRDAREQGVSPVPYLLVTLCLGSIGPLLYLLRRPEQAEAAAHAPALARAH
jgi:hypothetical protein